MGSIVTQLQEEMEALKKKLREADEKMRSKQIELENLNAVSNCGNCLKLEEKLEEHKIQIADTHAKFEELKKQLEESIKDLEKEEALRAGLENEWQEKREAHKNEVHALREQVHMVSND